MKNKRGASDGGTRVAYGDTVALVIAAVLAVTMFWACAGVRTVYTTIALVVLVIGEAALPLWHTLRLRSELTLNAVKGQALSRKKKAQTGKEGKT